MKRNQTLRRGLSVLLALVLCLSLLPSTALAEGTATTNQTADFTDGDGRAALTLLRNGDVSTADWDSESNTLTLKGVDFTTTASTAVKLPADATIVLAAGTENTITSTSQGKEEDHSSAIFTEGSLTITGEGQLTATGGTADFDSCGIFAYASRDTEGNLIGGSITISGGTVEAKGGTVDGDNWYCDELENFRAGMSCGMSAYFGDVTITGGTVTATGAGVTGSSSQSCGIYAYRDLTISGGAVTATGGAADKLYSYGIYTDCGDVDISGGTVEAKGGAANYNSYGFYAKGIYDDEKSAWIGGAVTISGGAVTATGGAANNISYGIYSEGGDVAISGGTVEAKGGAVKAGGGVDISLSYGICSEDGDVSISGKNTKVTATGGTADHSYGICASSGDVTISGGTVTATGGTANNDSWGIYTKKGDVNINDTAEVTATGGAAWSGSYGIYASSGDVTIEGGAVTATGGEANGFSYGIYVTGGDVTISGGTVTATGGTANNDSCGICAGADKKITISGGHVIAQTLAGGAALNKAPVLDDYEGYRWRTSTTGAYTDSKETPYTNDSAPTYVEFSSGSTVTASDKTADFTTDAIAALKLLNDAKTEGAADSTWDSTNKILTLNGVNFSTSTAPAVKLPADTTIVLAAGTENTIANVPEGLIGTSYGIYACGDITIQGSGTLTVTSGAAGQFNVGINASGDVTISGSAKVIATGGASDEMFSYGISTTGNMTISDSAEVTATGGQACSDSCGIDAYGDVTISDTAEVTATGGGVTGKNAKSYGINAPNGAITISGGHVTAKTLAGESATTRMALNADPDLEAYANNIWRTSPNVPFTTDTAYKNSDTYTYVEFCDGSTYVEYGVTVNDVEVTSLNKDDVLINGLVRYDPDTNTVYKTGSVNPLTIAGNGSTDVVLEGVSQLLTVTGAKNVTVTDVEISAWAKITCTGDVAFNYEKNGVCGLTVEGARNVTVISSHLDRPAIQGSATINCSGDVTISSANNIAFSGSSSLTVTAARDVTVTANTTSSLKPAIGGNADITCTGDVTISNTGGGKAVAGNLTYQNASGKHSYTVKTGDSLENLTDYATKEAGDTFTATLDAAAVKISAPHTAGEWQSNSTQHWKVCTVCGIELEREDHTFSGNTCTECGYTKSSGGGSSSSGGGSSAPTYVPSVTQPENGAVTVSPKAPKKGDTVTITPKPEAGYTVEQILVTDKNGDPVKVTNNGDGTFSFTQPAGKVNVEVTFMEDNSMLNFFVDVPAGAYYYDAVLWAAENGITGGVDDTHFAPNAPCTRAQMVTFLWRAAGSPKTSGSNPFSDVSADAYYYDAVLWAVENGITSGTSATTFAPDATVTRGQTVTFLYRAAGSPAASGSGFSDVSSDAYYADAVAWAVQQNITTGTGNGQFSPNADCTRAQIVTFLFRAMGE